MRVWTALERSAAWTALRLWVRLWVRWPGRRLSHGAATLARAGDVRLAGPAPLADDSFGFSGALLKRDDIRVAREELRRVLRKVGEGALEGLLHRSGRDRRLRVRVNGATLAPVEHVACAARARALDLHVGRVGIALACSGPCRARARLVAVGALAGRRRRALRGAAAGPAAVLMHVDRVGGALAPLCPQRAVICEVPRVDARSDGVGEGGGRQEQQEAAEAAWMP
mmetsp:Transcript_46480/g.150971  ORF Transcript_46480/g.150971 Transcript_46480/m.150971 type:complete len:226 (+) Transcript_46480:288-965(+)